MALTYGFYNSIDGDRVYDAIQFGSIFDGIIKDGVYATYLKGMVVIASNNAGEVIIQPGRAWFNHTWSYNDANLIMEAPAPEVLLDRIDALVLEINEELSARTNSFKWVQGTPSSRPVRPTLTNTATIHQYPLCYVRRYPETTMIYTRDITNMVGTSECPFATGVLEGIDLDAWINQWNDEFHNWENVTKNEFNNWETATKNEFETWMLNQEDVYTAWFTALRSQMDNDVQEVEDFVAYLESVLDASTAAHLQQEIDDLKTEITAGSQITVTTQNTELYNRNVTITEPGGTVLTEKFNGSGVAEFKSVPYVGNLSIASTYGQQTASKVVNTPYYARYEFAIAFWAATVNIVGDIELAGQSVVVRDSNQSIVGTVVLDNTGAGVYTAIKPDTYKFTLTYGGETMEVILSVTQETTYTVELHYKVFDYEDWLEAGGVTGTYADLDAVLADEVALRRLFTVHASVDYLASIDKDDEDLEKIINNDYCAKWINLRDYALDTLYANEIIAGYMDEADMYFYGEWALMPQVPKMIDNNRPYGTAIESSEASTDFSAWKAFDSDGSTRWVPLPNVTDNYVGYTFIRQSHIKKVIVDFAMAVVSGYSAPSKTFKVQTYNNSTWSDVGTITTDVMSSKGKQTKEVEIDSTCEGVRLFCTDVLSVASQWNIGVYSLQFYAWAPKGNIPPMNSNSTPMGEAIFSSVYSDGSDYPAWKAFDDDVTTAFICGGDTLSEYIGYRSNVPIKAKRFHGITGAKRFATYKIQATNGDTGWIDVSGVNSVPNPNESGYKVIDCELNTDKYYIFYRLVPLSRPSGATSGMQTISMSTFQLYGREMKSFTPLMISNNNPYGIASGSTGLDGSGKEPFNAFSAGTWYSITTEGYVQLTYPKPMVVKAISFRAPGSGSSTNSRIKGYRFTGINSGSSTQLLSAINQYNDSLYIAKYFENDTAYETYRFNIDDIWGGSYAAVGRLMFYGFDYSEREFESGTSKKYLYDHGLMLDGEIPSTQKGYSVPSGYSFKDPDVFNDHLHMECTTNNTLCFFVKSFSTAQQYNHMFANVITRGGDSNSPSLSGALALYASKAVYGAIAAQAILKSQTEKVQIMWVGSITNASTYAIAANAVGRALDLYELWLD